MRRIAVVGLFDSAERDKLALLLHGIQRAGHHAVLVDAEIFAGTSPRGRLGEVVVDGIRGRHRTVDGATAQVTVDGITVLTGSGLAPLCGSARPGTARAVIGPYAVDAVWPDALDITRRLEFESLYREIAAQRIPSLAGSWESVLNATYKHRTRRILAGASPPLPQPRHTVVTADVVTADAELCGRTAPVDVWVKAPGDTHSHGVFWVPRGREIDTAVRQALRPTPDGRLCLVEEDVCGVDDEGRRIDFAVTVLDGRAIHATVRAQSAEGMPTNSVHGGRSTAVDPITLPTEIRRLAVDAVTATGNRYGSTDIFGPADSPVVGEVNVMPGGRGPGFLARVVDPLVSAYVAEIERRPGAPGRSFRAQ
uniref:ATP-grasp domain-containing protein n=1 Tax=Paractinoplanes polyasparticus TaxID=2856853 RepID=UPI001C858D6E|nr:hypothetical protein [Actinoplanes polyasparticus]